MFVGLTMVTALHFTHHGPFEGTETSCWSDVKMDASHFTHHGPFEGTETNIALIPIRFRAISLTMARLRVLKLKSIATLQQTKTNFTHHGPFEGTET